MISFVDNQNCSMLIVIIELNSAHKVSNCSDIAITQTTLSWGFNIYLIKKMSASKDDKNRVVLTDGFSEGKATDYINASYITVGSGACLHK